jgi:hypothetical protein
VSEVLFNKISAVLPHVLVLVQVHVHGVFHIEEILQLVEESLLMAFVEQFFLNH